MPPRGATPPRISHARDPGISGVRAQAFYRPGDAQRPSANQPALAAKASADVSAAAAHSRAVGGIRRSPGTCADAGHETTIIASKVRKSGTAANRADAQDRDPQRTPRPRHSDFFPAPARNAP